MSKDFKITILAIILIVLAIGLLTPVNRGTNCGGNSAALYVCGRIALLAQTYAMDSSNEVFRFNDMNDEDKGDIAHLSDFDWTRGARYLVSTQAFRIQKDGSNIMAVCDKSYRNVPRRKLLRAPPTHAVAYSSGEVGLISEKQFQNIDTNLLVDARTLTIQGNGR